MANIENEKGKEGEEKKVVGHKRFRRFVGKMTSERGGMGK